MILVTRATGNTDGVVVAQLHKRRVPFKVMVRTDKARKFLGGLGYETVDGDFDQPQTLAAALQSGFDKAYLVCTPDEQMLASSPAESFRSAPGRGSSLSASSWPLTRLSLGSSSPFG